MEKSDIVNPHILIVSALFPPEPVVSASISKDICDVLSQKEIIVLLTPRSSRPYGTNFNESSSTTTVYCHYSLKSFTYPKSKLIGRMIESISFGLHVFKYIKINRKNIKTIYANTWPIFSQILIIKAARKYKIPVILHIQDIYPESLTSKAPKIISCIFNKLFIAGDKYILRNSTKVICISNQMINYLSNTRKIDFSKFVLVRNWQNIMISAKKLPNKNNEFTFLYAGNLSYSAGIEYLIYSFNNIRNNNISLIIAGEGTEKKLLMNIVQSLDNKHIRFESLNTENIAEIHSKADVLLLPLRKGVSMTATPSKLSAYMLSSKPIIACVDKNSDTYNIISESKCGYISEPENITELTEYMAKMINLEKTMLLKLGINAKKYAETYLSKEVNLQRIIDVITNNSYNT